VNNVTPAAALLPLARLPAALLSAALLTAALVAPGARAQEPSPAPAPAPAPAASRQTGQTDDDGASAQRRRRGGDVGEAALELAGKEIKVSYPKLKAESDDFAALESLPAGGVHSYVGGRAFKLLTAGDLVFGEQVVEAGNAAPGYPGVYSVWLKRVGDDSWSLVFNDDADIWGSQREAAADAVEVPVAHSAAPEIAAQVVLALEQTGPDTGILRLTWGARRWEAPFQVR
jgi:hypothetical protein